MVEAAAKKPLDQAHLLLLFVRYSRGNLFFANSSGNEV